MSRQPGSYVPMTPVTPIWAGGHDLRTAQRSRLLPSALEMNTPPQTVPRKNPSTGASIVPQMSNMPVFRPLDNSMNTISNSPANMSVLDTTTVNETLDHPGNHSNSIRPGHDALASRRMGPGYEMIELPTSLYTNPNSPRSSYSAHSGIRPIHGVDASLQNRYHPEGYHGRFPLLQTSYAQYNPDGVYPLQPRMDATTINNYSAGRISKSTARKQRYAPSDMPCFPVPMGYAGQGIAQSGGSFAETSPTGSYRDTTNAVPPKTQGRYTEYNHYIMRHLTSQKCDLIWSPDVEVAFMEAVWLIPGEPSKILVNRRTRGRNELISDYIKHKLGEERSRKQVSSHLQVLKKLLRDDGEFLECVGPKKIGNSPTDEIGSKVDSKKNFTMSVNTLAQLISKLKQAKRNQKKPRFLLQAEANLRESERNASNSKNSRSIQVEYLNSAAQPNMLGPQSINQHTISQPIPSINLKSSSAANATAHTNENMNSVNTQTNPNTTTPPHHPNTTKVMNSSAHVAAPNTSPDSIQTPVVERASRISSIPSFEQQEPPLRHPRPLHAQDLQQHTIEHIVPPSASVPPKDVVETTVTPRIPRHVRHPSRHHRRTTSTSVDLSGDRVLPVQFKMARNLGSEQTVYTRLLRATYESPTRPVEIQSLVPKFSDLAKMHDDNQLEGVQIVHVNVSLFIKPGSADPQTIREEYSSEVQYVLTANSMGSQQHCYIAKTVVTSWSTELLRCDIPCLFHKLAGRGLEQDKEVVNVPFLPDFWADFLARLNNSEHEYVQAALSALAIQQSIYCVNNDREELCFVSLYQFSAAQDEFSARTRFRRVRGVNKTKSVQNNIKIEPAVFASPQRNKDVPILNEPSTPTRVGRNSHDNMTATPRLLGTPSLLGIGTPGQILGSLGTFINSDSPSMFASPRRLNTIDNIDISGSPFIAITGNESRGSPRSSKFEIQRAMTAFEPSAWDEMHDWVYQ